MVDPGDFIKALGPGFGSIPDFSRVNKIYNLLKPLGQYKLPCKNCAASSYVIVGYNPYGTSPLYIQIPASFSFSYLP
jgi:hypothetical protein